MVGPYIEGDTLRLYCDVYGGKPAPTVSWHRNDRLISNKTLTVRSGVTRSELVIKNLGRDDVRSMLTCNATNNNRSIPLSSSVHVDMNCKYRFITTTIEKSRNNRWLVLSESFSFIPP
ncbi:hypothetical protein WN48_10841 [Eufriesea mexicana]|uniref:Ig-like domain-containing protein n=2 Tax=Eufriesea mexicana TaxID=516756 RepID=A0A310SCQ7_9HYME|nr:hypothetical protein WN48_10841 [Eufriesea mexicana]